jgi:hypothetical protein
MMVVMFFNSAVIVSGHLLSVRDESLFQLIIALRPIYGHMVACFLTLKLEPTDASPSGCRSYF